MLFNSLEFLVFLAVVFLLHWFVFSINNRSQNIFLLLASYFFYACWDWRFLFLLLFSTLLDYFTGLRISNAKNNRSLQRFWLWLSIAVNLGFLGIFKYYNFFISGLVSTGLDLHTSTLNVILPVGISFYTFHGLSYVIDIYYDRIKPETDFTTYSLFVSFFPLLVAGPIERATHLLPQVKQQRTFSLDQSVNGLRQILWGFFKKVVIADNCASYADLIFDHPTEHSGSTLLLGALFFTFQIYCDFSGYSDIALGTARLFGIELLKNFAFPYFSRDIAEFWRRWHISLSSWFRDYVYIPLGGSKVTKLKQVRNTFIIFVLSGFWHGANWTFVVWGFLNALYFLPSLLLNRNRKYLGIVAENQYLPSFRDAINMTATFGLVVFGWIFFRAKTIHQAISFIAGIFSRSFFTIPYFNGINTAMLIVALTALFIIIEWIGRRDNYAIEKLGLTWSRPVRWSFYSFILFIIGMYMHTSETQFIYFQF